MLRRHSSIFTRAILCLVLSTAFQSVRAQEEQASQPPSSTDVEAHEHWKGAITLPTGELEFQVRFVPPDTTDDPFLAFLTIPAQGVKDAKMTNVIYTKQEIAFSFAPVLARFEADIAPDGQSASGTLKQAGQTLPLTLKRQTLEQMMASKPKRPQTPQPPFPYEAIEVTYTNDIDNITLAGTLTIPNGAGPFPAVILITGSGPQDRDETLMGHKPFLVIADHLSRNGIAVLRSDDRGVGGSGGSVMQSTTQDFARDALAALKFLEDHDQINPDQIGLMGHSEGGIVAPIAASRSRDVAFIVLLAGTGLPGEDILRLQTRLLTETAGTLSEEQIDSMIEKHQAFTASIINDDPEPQQRAALLELMRAQGTVGPDALLNDLANLQMAQMQSPWMRYFLTYDPRTALINVTCPVLAINGSLDLQVPADDNLREIAAALSEARNADVTTRKLDGLNHLFQNATTGSPAEYATIEETFDPQTLDLITDWITTRFPTRAPGPAPAGNPATAQ